MTRLPRALLPWEPWLDAFPPDLALAIGPWLVRLGLAIGPLQTTSRSGAGDLDGLAGLSRRGPYDRLVLTEWLYADELPDEFNRRAAMREHLFLDLHRLDPVGRRRSIVLFDVGPDQLGGPRLAHLALAVVLARRAEAAGVPLVLGAIQAPEPIPWTGVGCVTRLLASRSPGERPRRDHLDAWSEAAAPEKADDLWLVGGPAVARLGAGSAITLAEGADPGARTLEVAVKPLDGPVRGVTLDLPDAPTAVRLLRDPFQLARRAPVRTPVTGPRPHGRMAFSTDGRRLLTRTPTGGVVAWHVPGSPAAQPIGAPRRFEPPAGHTLVAAGFANRSLLAITRPADAEKLVAWRLEHRIASDRRRDYHPDFLPVDADDWTDLAGFDAVGPTDLQRLLLVHGSANGRQVLVTDGHGSLWVWCPEHRDGAARARANRQYPGPVAGLRAGMYEAYFLGWREDERRVFALGANGVPRALPVPSLGAGPMQAVTGHGGQLSPECGVYAAPLADGRWRLLYKEPYPSREHRVVDLVVPGGATVHGVTRTADAKRAGLVVLGEDRRQLWLLTETATVRLAQERSPIAAACASDEHANVAWHTEDGRLCVWSIDREAFLLEMLVGAGAGDAA